MIRRYTFGSPLPTDAVVKQLPAENGSLPYFEMRKTEEGGLSFSLPLHPEEVIFGLGQMVRGINKRGHRYESWNSDVFNHTESVSSLYGSHNFLVFFSPEYTVITNYPQRLSKTLAFLKSNGITRMNFSCWGITTLQTDGTKWIVSQDPYPRRFPEIRIFLKNNSWLQVPVTLSE